MASTLEREPRPFCTGALRFKSTVLVPTKVRSRILVEKWNKRRKKNTATAVTMNLTVNSQKIRQDYLRIKSRHQTSTHSLSLNAPSEVVIVVTRSCAERSLNKLPAKHISLLDK